MGSRKNPFIIRKTDERKFLKKFKMLKVKFGKLNTKKLCLASLAGTFLAL
jgi:hypothetical protein